VAGKIKQWWDNLWYEWYEPNIFFLQEILTRKPII
jgi:hypothetical protein